MKFKLFIAAISSFFAFNTTIYTINAKDLIPGGENIGIELKADGLLVTGTYDIKYNNKTYNPEKDSDIKRGDLIYKMNNHDVKSLDDLPMVFKDINSLVADIEIEALRENKKITRNLKLIKNSMTSSWKTGLLVKERLLGIGTVTFYDPETKMYGALGHQLSDSDFGPETELSYGSIYTSDVISIKKSEDGKPGEKVVKIYEDKYLGSISKNTPYGIFGYVDELPEKNTMETASQDEVKLGDAEIWTVVFGKVVEKFSIKITNLKKQDKIEQKGITFEITDERLLNKANGIVQGMSGSPIIQNNKIVGAVTHVFVDDVTKGYGIYIEWMLEQL